MQIAVMGLWHLGCVTAAAVAAKGFEIIAYDADESVIAQLKKGYPPITEPGLTELLSTLHQQKKIHFTNRAADLATTDIIWCTYDTPVNELSEANSDFIADKLNAIFPHVKNHAYVIISSQVPVGFTHEIKRRFNNFYPTKTIEFIYSPENLRLGQAIKAFNEPERIIIGADDHIDRKMLTELLTHFSSNLIWMSVKSAEMTKHAINSFLAMSVTFINEIAQLCEIMDVDARSVELGLKTEKRIGRLAYLKPGSAIAGGTLLRDVDYLVKNSNELNVDSTLLKSILKSNTAHAAWTISVIKKHFPNLRKKIILVVGIAYKQDTDTLRCSLFVNDCRELAAHGACVRIIDSNFETLPTELGNSIQLINEIDAFRIKPDVIIFNTIEENKLIHWLNKLKIEFSGATICDANGIFYDYLNQIPHINYVTVGNCNFVEKEIGVVANE